ncbi:hypothetical protein SAMN05443635_110163 [Roseobacter denitrificans OCh 114]|nr:hypothetical protein SAMN05443635_110163 [Roseobacter denitrificans OCh 114]
MRLVAHAHQDRPDLKPAAFHFQDVAHARGSIGMGKDQHIRGPLHAIAGQDARAQLCVERCVDVHLALIAEVMVAAVEQRNGTAQPPAGAFALVAEL